MRIVVVMQAVEMAVWQRQEEHQVILHSDRGTQFTCGDYQRLLKRERINYRLYRTRDEARADIFDDIERFHNPRMRRRLANQDCQFTSLQNRP